MSYILDALRKSEQERQAGSVPGLTTPQPSVPASPRAHGPWKIAVALLLAVNAGAVGWWLARPAPATASRVVATTPVPAPLAASPAVAAPAVAGGPAATQMPAPVAPPAVPPNVSATKAAELPETRIPPPEPPPARQAPPASAPAVEDNPPPPPRGGVVPYADLPPAIKKAMPPLNIGGYADAGGGAIMLLVDDRLVKEGDELAGGVRVVKITPEGSVFSFRNYRFRR